MRQVRIIVEQLDTKNVGSFKVVFQRTLCVPEDVVFDYDVIEQGIKALFRDIDNLVLTFKISKL